jgi:hypothetical protein
LAVSGRTNEPDRSDAADLLNELEELDDIVDDSEAQRRLDNIKTLTGSIQGPAFGRVVYGFDRRNAAEAALGTLPFGIPIAVEGGTNEAGAFVAGSPACSSSRWPPPRPCWRVGGDYPATTALSPPE